MNKLIHKNDVKTDIFVSVFSCIFLCFLSQFHLLLGDWYCLQLPDGGKSWPKPSLCPRLLQRSCIISCQRLQWLSLQWTCPSFEQSLKRFTVVVSLSLQLPHRKSVQVFPCAHPASSGVFCSSASALENMRALGSFPSQAPWLSVSVHEVPTHSSQSQIKALDGTLESKQHWQKDSSYSAEKHADASWLHTLLAIAFTRESKTWNLRHFCIRRDTKKAEGRNAGNVAVGDKAILFPLNMSAEKHLR